MPQQLRVTVTRPTIRLALGSVPASVAGVGSINGMDGIVTLTAADVDAQPVDADLTALAALSGTGYAQRTGDGTWTLGTPSSPVTSVNGLTGVVVLDAAAVGAAPTSHTHAQYAIAADLGELALLDLADLPSAPVSSVNGATGAVVLDAADVGADPSGTASSATAALAATLGDAATLDVGTIAGTVAAGDHTHTPGAIGAQAASAELSALAGVAATGWLKRTGTATYTTATPNASDVGADAAGTASGAVAAHAGAADPHPGYVLEGTGWASAFAFAYADAGGALVQSTGAGLSILVLNFSDSSAETWTVTPYISGLLDDVDGAAARATLGLGELATMDLADLPGGSGIAAGAAWSPVAAGALTVDAWSATADPTLAVAGDVVSCAGIGGFVTASGAIPALLDLRLDDLSGVAVGYGVGAAVGIPDGSSSVWAVVGVFRETSSVWRLMFVSRTVPHYIFGWWTEIGGVSTPYPDLAAPPVRVRWDHGASHIRVQLADLSWLEYGPVDLVPALAPRETQTFPTAWGVGLVRLVDATPTASSATVRLFSGADDGDIAWIGGDAGDELSRQPVPAVLSVLARSSGGASRSVPVGPVGAEVFGAETQAAGRTSLGLGDSATRNVGTTAGTVAAGDDTRFTSYRSRLSEHWMVG